MVYELYNTTDFKDPMGNKALIMPIEMFDQMYSLATQRGVNNNTKLLIYNMVMQAEHIRARAELSTPQN